VEEGSSEADQLLLRVHAAEKVLGSSVGAVLAD
jgi:hypothetical protein